MNSRPLRLGLIVIVIAVVGAAIGVFAAKAGEAGMHPVVVTASVIGKPAPGTAGDLLISLANDNSKAMSVDGTIDLTQLLVDAAHSACNVGAVHVQPIATHKSIPANDEAIFTAKGTFVLPADADAACESATFEVTMAFKGSTRS